MKKHKADDQASAGLEMDRHGPPGLYGRDQGSEPGRVRTSYSCYCSCCLSLTTLPHLSLDERGFSGGLVVAVAAPDVFVVLGIVVVVVMIMVVPASLVDVTVQVSVLDVSVTGRRGRGSCTPKTYSLQDCVAGDESKWESCKWSSWE